MADNAIGARRSPGSACPTRCSPHRDTSPSPPGCTGRPGLTPDDIDVALLYDHFTPMVLMQLKDYPGEPGTVVSGSFVLDGTRFIAIDGGPQFAFTEAVSFTVSCKGQDEVDYYWSRSSRVARRRSAAGSRTASA